MEEIPEYAELFAKHPELHLRQKAFDSCVAYDPDTYRGCPSPIDQVFDRWIGGWYGWEFYHATNRAGETEEMPFGTLLPLLKREPPMGIFDPDYRQPQADFVKPFLLCIGDTFYSVYGDCQVAEHIPVKTESGQRQLGAMCYAGNLLYAVSRELPPATQSCGIYQDRMVWVGDMEGYVVLYLAEERRYIRRVVIVPGVARLLIPRRNETGSLFAFDEDAKLFKEHLVESPESNPTTKPGQRELPQDLKQILFCDSRNVVACSAREILVQTAPNARVRRQAVDMREDETIVEGVYVPQKRTVGLLIGRRVDPSRFNVLEVQKSWEEMRPVWIDLEQHDEGAEVKGPLPVFRRPPK
ncbi:MAG: hypothetical protein RBU25_07250 [Lentisphaeria bacterium]|jgi:hypothetical protein|nr:hypothetical protein [Lentisphaeria bacterium]